MDEHAQLTAHTAALRAIARAVVGDPHEADDAVQDAWVAALDRPPGTGPVPLAWLRTVVRRGSWRRARDLRLRVPVEAGGPAVEATAVAEELLAAVRRLPEAYREVVELRYWSGLPPRRIATELGVDVRVVRNRLHRALSRLRRELERGEGERCVGLPALALFAHGGEPSVLSPVAAILALSMSTKLAAAAAALVVAAVAIGLRPLAEPAAPAGAPPPVAALEGTPATVRAPSTAERTEVEPAPPAVDGEPRPEDRVELVAAGQLIVGLDPTHGLASDRGGLKLEVRDANDRSELDDFSLVLTAGGPDANPTAAGNAESLRVATFPAGRFEALLASKGYDHARIGPFDVVPNRTTDLGTHWLAPGTAVLEGTVELPSDLAASVQSVQLHGPGRRAGACCEPPVAAGATADQAQEPAGPQHCETCGYGEDYSLRSLVGVDRFRFENLASGFARAVVVDHLGGVLAAEEVAIEPSGFHDVVIDVAFKDIEVTLVDADGAPFEGLWVEEGALYSASVLMHLWIDDVLAAEAVVHPLPEGTVLGRGSFSNPIDEGLAVYHPRSSSDGSDPLRALWPRAVVERPAVARGSRPVERLRPGTYLIRDVPAECDAVQIACGPFVTDVHGLAENPGLRESAEVAVDARCGFPSRQMVTATQFTCTSCHAATAR